MERKRLTIEINEKFHAEVKTKAYSEGKTIKNKIVELLETWLNGVNKTAS